MSSFHITLPNQEYLQYKSTNIIEFIFIIGLIIIIIIIGNFILNTQKSFSPTSSLYQSDNMISIINTDKQPLSILANSLKNFSLK